MLRYGRALRVSEYRSISRRFFRVGGSHPRLVGWLGLLVSRSLGGSRIFLQPVAGRFLVRGPPGLQEGRPMRPYANKVMRIQLHLALFVFVTANKTDNEQDPLISAIYAAHSADDLYGILGIRPRSKQSQLKEAYKTRARLVRSEKAACAASRKHFASGASGQES